MTETFDGTSTNGSDVDVGETTEWLDALDAVVQHDGVDRARHLLTRVVERAQHSGSGPIGSLNTPYVNTIPASLDEPIPGDSLVERRLRSIIRWNAMAMVVRANKYSSELGGHLASFQGHSSPGNYARAYLEGRLSEEQLDNFRQEVGGNGLSSYPHPWLMPDFWQFPTVSLGIGAITSIYQARFMKYMQARGLAETKPRKVWAFLG